MKKVVNKNKLKKSILIITSILLVLTIIAGTIAFIANYPDKRKPVFNDADKKPSKTVFNEGEFKMGEYDLVVSVNGDDNAEGTLKEPLKTLTGAKEKLKSSNIPKDEPITVWFREGTYTFFDTVSFDDTDRSNVLYRSYPNENVVFSGSKEIKGCWNETTINNIKAFVANIEIQSDNDYFHSLFGKC